MRGPAALTDELGLGSAQPCGCQAPGDGHLHVELLALRELALEPGAAQREVGRDLAIAREPYAVVLGAEREVFVAAFRSTAGQDAYAVAAEIDDGHPPVHCGFEVAARLRTPVDDQGRVLLSFVLQAVSPRASAAGVWERVGTGCELGGRKPQPNRQAVSKRKPWR